MIEGVLHAALQGAIVGAVLGAVIYGAICLKQYLTRGDRPAPPDEEPSPPGGERPS